MNAALFLSWWRARLGELIPAFLRRRWGSAKAGITLAIDAGRLQISSANRPSSSGRESPATRNSSSSAS